jgi:phospholipase C
MTITLKTRAAFFFALLLAAFLILFFAPAEAQPHFNHVVVIVQENRSPDNLFSACTIPGADLQQTGTAGPLNTTYDLNHSHAGFLADLAGNWQSGAKAYVRASDIAPYCQLATQYGFANRFFQTNQGPSRPAHFFLFAGTSTRYEGDTAYQSENSSAFCKGTATYIRPDGTTFTDASCLNHLTLAQELEAAGLTWRYYAPSLLPIWNSPAGIRDICVPVNGACTGPDYAANVDTTPSHVLSDISGGNLRNVSWVVPAGVNSDHPQYGGGGPAWVASIVNAVGASPYWQDTLVIVVWDDWGGWYDHVTPLVNTTGWCVSYCYGFRVPMLVVSSVTPAGYISNAPMDFGSILKFVEQNWNLPLIGDGTHADAWANPFDAGFFSTSHKPRSTSTFTPIRTRPLTEDELASKSDPDDD